MEVSAPSLDSFEKTADGKFLPVNGAELEDSLKVIEGFNFSIIDDLTIESLPSTLGFHLKVLTLPHC